MERAGISILANYVDFKACCETLRKNRPEWNVIEGDISKVDFTPYRGQVDIVSGGFPCQKFSYTGKKLAFEDVRGTMFFEFARTVKETNPKVFIAENVRHLLNHDGGKTLEVIRGIIEELGYKLVEPRVLNAVHYNVPLWHQRLFLVGIRSDLVGLADFKWPVPSSHTLTMKDALMAGALYPDDVPHSASLSYRMRDREILSELSPGESKAIDGKIFSRRRRLSFDEPCPPLGLPMHISMRHLCHPVETRPLSVRECARLKTFPDSWGFVGSSISQYTQICRALPVNIAVSLGGAILSFLGDLAEFE